MVVVLGAGIRSVSLLVDKPVKRSPLLSVLLTAPRWVALLHHCFLLEPVRVLRGLLIRRAPHYFPLLLIFRLALARRTILPCGVLLLPLL